MIRYRPPRHGDVVAIARDIADIDRRECAAKGFTPKRALHLGRIGSLLCWTAESDGRPVAMFGLSSVSLVDGHGRPWLLRTEDAGGVRTAFLRDGPAFVARMQGLTPRLSNHIHAENLRSIRWLKRLGFDIDTERKLLGGEPMLRFSKGF